MLVCFYGSDISAARDAARAYEAALPSTRLMASEWQPGMLQERAYGASFFAERERFILDSFSEDAAAFTEVLDAAADLAASPHLFVIVEGPLTADIRKRLEKHASELFAHERAKVEKPNMFVFADLLLARDKKKLWEKLQHARTLGESPEAIAGIFAWQLRVLSAAARFTSADEAGVAAYPFDKARRASQKFPQDFLEAQYAALLNAYVAGHGGSDMWSELERFVLRV